MSEHSFDIIIIGGGPAGYVGAFRAAERGARTAVVEEKYLGGTCLNVGCIPTKALIHAAELLDSAKEASRFGISFGPASFDPDKVRAYKDRVVKQLVSGVEFLLGQRKVEVFRGHGTLTAPGEVRVDSPEGAVTLQAPRVVLCTGSYPVRLPLGDPQDPAIMTSDEAVQLPGPPASLAIIGAGAIGCEFAYLYSAFGAQVTLVEMLPRIMPTEDPEAAEVLAKSLAKRGVKMVTGARVTALDPCEAGRRVEWETETCGDAVEVEQVLVAVGRRSATANLGLEALGVAMDRANVKVNERLETSVPGLYAAGDCVRGVGLAHQASHEALAAVDNALGYESPICESCIPAGIYTNPEIASVGLREHEATERGIAVTVGKFPFSALAKATVLGKREGFVKLVADAASGVMLGGTIVGPHATELIAEITLAVQHKLTLADVAETVHGHPTLNEAVGEAAFAGIGLPLHYIG